MNILLINHYAGSPEMGMEFRPYYLAKEWVKMGHKVDIIAADYSHLRRKNPVISKDFEVEVIDGINYHWIHTRTYEGNGASRAITMAQFVGKLWLDARKITESLNPDIIITSSTYPLDIIAGKKIKKKSKSAILTHEIHDMWPITPIELYGMSKHHPFVAVMQYGENYFCKNADNVVSILPNAREYLVEHGMDNSKFHFVSNGIDMSDWENPMGLPEEHSKAIIKAKEQGRLVIGFFGSHTRSYSLDYLIDAATKCDQSRIYLMFVGAGNYKGDLIKRANERRLSNDCYGFLPPINKQAIPSLLEGCDASYVGAIKNDMFRFGIGMNKLFDAMMGGKPILYAVKAPNNLIEEHSCGISVEAEDVDALAQGINELLSMSEEDRLRMGKNGKKAVLENYNFPVLAKKFLEIY